MPVSMGMPSKVALLGTTSMKVSTLGSHTMIMDTTIIGIMDTMATTDTNMMG